MPCSCAIEGEVVSPEWSLRLIAFSGECIGSNCCNFLLCYYMENITCAVSLPSTLSARFNEKTHAHFRSIVIKQQQQQQQNTNTVTSGRPPFIRKRNKQVQSYSQLFCLRNGLLFPKQAAPAGTRGPARQCAPTHTKQSLVNKCPVIQRLLVL